MSILARASFLSVVTRLQSTFSDLNFAFACSQVEPFLALPAPVLTAADFDRRSPRRGASPMPRFTLAEHAIF